MNKILVLVFHAFNDRLGQALGLSLLVHSCQYLKLNNINYLNFDFTKVYKSVISFLLSFINFYMRKLSSLDVIVFLIVGKFEK